MEYVAVFGVGSTNFRYAVATPDGTFLTDVTVEATRPRDVAAQLVDAVSTLQDATAHGLDAVGVACTGLVDPATGTVFDLDTPDGETISRTDLATPVAETHDLPVFVANDCNAAALGEWYFGARTDQDCLAHVTFGTGIGGGVVEDGRLLRGDAGQAGEFGVLPVAPDSDLASTGVTGAWEAIASGRGIPEYVARRSREVEDGDGDRSGDRTLDDRTGAADETSRFTDSDAFTAEDVFDAAAAGDEFAQVSLDEIARYNGAGIAAVCNAVNPGLVTLGGGVALNNPEWIVDGIEASLDEFLFVDRPTVELSPLGDDVGLYGALATARADSVAPRASVTGTSPRGSTD